MPDRKNEIGKTKNTIIILLYKGNNTELQLTCRCVVRQKQNLEFSK